MFWCQTSSALCDQVTMLSNLLMAMRRIYVCVEVAGRETFARRELKKKKEREERSWVQKKVSEAKS